MSINFADYIYLDIPEGRVKQIADGSGNVIWRQGYINQVPRSTDTDGSIFNGTGYKENVRLSSSGGISSGAQNGSVTTGFIPYSGGDAGIIRLKGVRWLNTSQDGYGHYYIIFYDENKNKIAYISASEQPSYTHVLTVTRDANGVETFTWNQNYGTSNSLLQQIRSNPAFIRINAYGKGADFILTVNEEIT
jgi:hypothetical protein